MERFLVVEVRKLLSREQMLFLALFVLFVLVLFVFFALVIQPVVMAKATISGFGIHVLLNKLFKFIAPNNNQRPAQDLGT